MSDRLKICFKQSTCQYYQFPPIQSSVELVSPPIMTVLEFPPEDELLDDELLEDELLDDELLDDELLDDELSDEVSSDESSE